MSAEKNRRREEAQAMIKTEKQKENERQGERVGNA